MTSIYDFLVDRIDDDERTARAVVDGGYEPAWGVYYEREVKDDLSRDVVPSTDELPTDAVVEHVARFDPARVLAECSSKRRVLELHRPTMRMGEPLTVCQRCGESEAQGKSVRPGDSLWPCETVRLLALPYSDAPDYRVDWRL